MADGFTAVLRVFEEVKKSNILTYAFKAPSKTVTDGTSEFIVINFVSTPYGQVINTVMVNVNVYIPKPVNGMINSVRMKVVKDIINPLVKSAILAGGYFSAKPLFDQIFSDLEGKYDCLNLRYEIIETA